NEGEKIRKHDEYGYYLRNLKTKFKNTKLNQAGGFTMLRIQEFYELEKCVPFIDWYNGKKEPLSSDEYLEKTRGLIKIMDVTNKIPIHNNEYKTYIVTLKTMFKNTKMNKDGGFTKARMVEFYELN